MRKTHNFINKVDMRGFGSYRAGITRDILKKISHMVWTGIDIRSNVEVGASLKETYGRKNS